MDVITSMLGDIVTFLIIAGGVILYLKTKDRKESLVIVQEDDKVKFFLSDANYDEFDISDIKDDKNKIYNEIKKLVEAKAKELVKYVDKVTLFELNDKSKEDELLSIILLAK